MATKIKEINNNIHDYMATVIIDKTSCTCSTTTYHKLRLMKQNIIFLKNKMARRYCKKSPKYYHGFISYHKTKENNYTYIAFCYYL